MEINQYIFNGWSENCYCFNFASFKVLWNFHEKHKVNLDENIQTSKNDAISNSDKKHALRFSSRKPMKLKMSN